MFTISGLCTFTVSARLPLRQGLPLWVLTSIYTIPAPMMRLVSSILAPFYLSLSVSVTGYGIAKLGVDVKRVVWLHFVLVECLSLSPDDMFIFGLRMLVK
jgi:hypothetical protein